MLFPQRSYRSAALQAGHYGQEAIFTQTSNYFRTYLLYRHYLTLAPLALIQPHRVPPALFTCESFLVGTVIPKSIPLVSQAQEYRKQLQS